MERTDLIGANLAGGVERSLRGGGLGKGGGLAGERRLVAPHTRPRRHNAVARDLWTARGNGARRVNTAHMHARTHGHMHAHKNKNKWESES